MDDFKAAADAFMIEAADLTELLRAQRVRDFGILDTAPEQVFDEIAELACTITDVPSSAIVMIEGDRTFVKASFNSPFLGNYDRDRTICNTTIQNPTGVLLVEDSVSDTRFLDNPHVHDGDIKFYLGAPLVDDDGYAIGTLCVFDDHIRTVDGRAPFLLQKLGRITMNILTERKKKKER